MMRKRIDVILTEQSTTTTFSSSHHLLLFTPPDPQLSESVHVHESIEKLLLAAQLPKAATSVSQEGEREGEK
jgi:hypothetical protein